MPPASSEIEVRRTKARDQRQEYDWHLIKTAREIVSKELHRPLARALSSSEQGSSSALRKHQCIRRQALRGDSSSVGSAHSCVGARLEQGAGIPAASDAGRKGAPCRNLQRATGR